MFNIKRPEKISVKVSVKVPGVREPQKFTGHFVYLDMEERRAFVERISEEHGAGFTDVQVMKELLIDWEGVNQSDGAPLEHSDTAIETLMNIPYVCEALRSVLMSDVLSGVIARKN
ncbi:MAG: hypothetical protein OXU22_09695 [Gammaproteobacteria bacterium]|nr:hypothetical protein [Gammaproteobacteria bacterium]